MTAVMVATSVALIAFLSVSEDFPAVRRNIGLPNCSSQLLTWRLADLGLTTVRQWKGCLTGELFLLSVVLIG